MVIVKSDYSAIVSVESDFIVEAVMCVYDCGYSIMIQTKMQKERINIGYYNDFDKTQYVMAQLQKVIMNREDYLMPREDEVYNA